jgi:hypothetical protein
LIVRTFGFWPNRSPARFIRCRTCACSAISELRSDRIKLVSTAGAGIGSKPASPLTYEATVAGSGKAGAFSFGDTPTLADVCLMPQLFSADRFGADISTHQNLKRNRASCDVHPVFIAAHPLKQPDAEA